MKSAIKTITVNRDTNKTVKESYKEAEIEHDPWSKLCVILADAFLESRKKIGGDINDD